MPIIAERREQGHDPGGDEGKGMLPGGIEATRLRATAHTLALALAIALAGCHQSGPRVARDDVSQKPLGIIPVRADTESTHRFIRSTRRPDRSLDVVTRADSSWGTISERHTVDCHRWIVRRISLADVDGIPRRPDEPSAQPARDPTSLAVLAYLCGPGTG